MASAEKRNKRIAFITSLGVHGALLILFLFLMAWRQPNPPDKYKLPGVDINIGFVDEGGGETQPNEQPGAEKPTEEKTEETTLPEEKVVEQQPEQPIVSNEESPVVVKEQKKEPAKEKPIERPADVKPKDTQPTEDKKTEPVKSVADKPGKNVPSQGDDKGKTGDKGKPEGKPDAKGLYGQPGGGGGGDGMNLSMSGWEWAEKPKVPPIPDREPGLIKFEIECNEEGEIIKISTSERGLSPRAEQLLKEEIWRNSLVRTSGGAVPARSKGVVIFRLRAE
ncbi:MAG: cell envelope integrity protein TolA [Flammeovirgaceae bacterium]